ncbi:MAG: hypothetical protein PVH87_25490 [Desulfobacteraceae bacterium]
MKRLFGVIFVLAMTCTAAFGLNPEPAAVFVRVIDVGAGLCCVVKMPGDHYMVYDAGDYPEQGKVAFDGIAQLVPQGQPIELLVLSRSDSDHHGAVKRIFDHYTVKKVIRSGLERETQTWQRSNAAIKAARQAKKTRDINLKYYEFPPGATYRFGDVFVTFVCGFYAPPSDWNINPQTHMSEFRNAGSIAIRLQYKGKSILFTGDAVGRHIGDPDNALMATEKFMIANSAVIPIDSDVLIAPHHGADNGVSAAFIAAVSPQYVIFSAGHKYEHPRAAAANRYLVRGLSTDYMFRTDLGDDEGQDEWAFGRIQGHTDKAGDQDIDILIRPDGNVVVAYRE